MKVFIIRKAVREAGVQSGKEMRIRGREAVNTPALNFLPDSPSPPDELRLARAAHRDFLIHLP